VIEVSAYNPALDPDGSAARRVIDLLIEVLSPRLEDGSAAEPPTAEAEAVPVAASDAAPSSTEKLEATELPTPSSEPAPSDVAADAETPPS
jgi:hypothetical protein